MKCLLTYGSNRCAAKCFNAKGGVSTGIHRACLEVMKSGSCSVDEQHKILTQANKRHLPNDWAALCAACDAKFKRKADDTRDSMTKEQRVQTNAAYYKNKPAAAKAATAERRKERGFFLPSSVSFVRFRSLAD